MVIKLRFSVYSLPTNKWTIIGIRNKLREKLIKCTQRIPVYNSVKTRSTIAITMTLIWHHTQGFSMTVTFRVILHFHEFVYFGKSQLRRFGRFRADHQVHSGSGFALNAQPHALDTVQLIEPNQRRLNLEKNKKITILLSFLSTVVLLSIDASSPFAYHPLWLLFVS